MIARSMLWLAPAAGLLVLAGCDARPYPADTSGRVFYQDSNLKHFVVVERQQSDRIGGGLLRLRTDIRNRGKQGVWVDVQVVWQDADGFEKAKTNWAPLYLDPRYATTHEVNSLGPDVSDYQLRIRRPVKSSGP